MPIYKGSTEEARSGAIFLDDEWSIPLFRADFLRFTSKSVEVWPNLPISKHVRSWLREHNQTVLQEARTGKRGVRIIPCWLPTKSPWLNRIEPKWVHSKRAIVEPTRFLTAQEVRQRVCDYFGCEQVELLTQKVSGRDPLVRTP